MRTSDISPTAAALFARHVTHADCAGGWGWGGFVDRKGYGRMSVTLANGKRTTVGAHQVSYMLHRGDVPEGLELDHLCRNPLCSNPLHLEAVTHVENVRRGRIARGADHYQAQKTHCVNGHPFDEANTLRTGRRRHCRACQRAAVARHRQKRLASMRISKADLVDWLSGAAS